MVNTDTMLCQVLPDERNLPDTIIGAAGVKGMILGIMGATIRIIVGTITVATTAGKNRAPYPTATAIIQVTATAATLTLKKLSKISSDQLASNQLTTKILATTSRLKLALKF